MAIIDPRTGALTSGPGDLSQYGFTGFGGGGLLSGGSDFTNPLLTFGAGLLARSGPSLTPQSPWSAVGQALGQIPEAQQKSIENQMRRQALLESAQKAQGLQRIQDFVKNNPQLLQEQPLLGGLLSTGYEPVVQGVATALADPNYGINLATNKAKLAGDASTNANNWQNAYTGEAALKVLMDHPGSEALVKSPLVLQIAQGLKSAGDVLPQIKDLLPKNLSAEDAAVVLDAASTLVASKDALAAQGGIVGDTSNVGLSFYQRAFKQARERATAIASAGGKAYELPPPPVLTFGQPQSPPATTTATAAPPTPDAAGGSLSYSPQAGVQRTPASQHVVTDLPPAAAAPEAAPAPPPAEPFYTGPLRRTGTALGSAFDRLFGGSPSPSPAAPAPAPAATPASAPAATLPTKVQSLRYSPTTGLVMFRSKDEFNRAVKNGSLIKAMPKGGQVEIGGVTYPVTLGASGG